MANLSRLTPILTLLALFAARALAELDCSKPPKPKDIRACCKIPEARFDAYTQQCPQLKEDPKAQRNPCAFDCIFNASQALQNDQLNMGNVRTMLAAVFPDNADFSQAYALGFEKCEADAQQKIAEFKASGRAMPARPPGFLNCSPLPVMYTICAHRNVFVECPAAAWTASAVCEQAKEHIANCEQTRGSGRRGGGGGGGGGQRYRRMGGGAGGGAGMNQGAGVGFRSSAFY